VRLAVGGLRSASVCHLPAVTASCKCLVNRNPNLTMAAPPNPPPQTAKQGRAVLWAWMQERDRPPGDYDYACCLSAPRCLWLAPAGAASASAAAGSAAASVRAPFNGDGTRSGQQGSHSHSHAPGAANGSSSGNGSAQQLRLWQEPLPELTDLRRRSANGQWRWRRDADASGLVSSRSDGDESSSTQPPLRVAPSLRTAHCEIQVELEHGAGGGGGAAAALVLHPLGGSGEGAAVVFDWESKTLQVVGWVGGSVGLVGWLVGGV